MQAWPAAQAQCSPVPAPAMQHVSSDDLTSLLAIQQAKPCPLVSAMHHARQLQDENLGSQAPEAPEVGICYLPLSSLQGTAVKWWLT